MIPSGAGFRNVALILMALLVSACGSSQSVDSASSGPVLVRGAGPDGSFYEPPANGSGKSVATQWPIVLSHPFSVTAELSFRGDTLDSSGSFDAYGVKKMLEAGGAVVYQPNKLAYASNETRGKLLYKKCAGTTLNEILCKGANPVEVDGIHLATKQYCSDPALRARHDYSSEDECRRKLQFNIICHSQGCPDSRYMLAAVRNEYSGELMYKHVVSWTSMAGANKGTAEADWAQEILLACITPGCRSIVLDLVFGEESLRQNEAIITNAGDSVIALTRKYMMQTTDMNCTPSAGTSCAPSFNQLYPLPVDPSHPIYYQTFTSRIENIDHPCYEGKKFVWQIVQDREGPNDGNISVDSQRFTTYGADGSGGATPVISRWISGTTSDPTRPHPGLNHMAYADSKVPGMNEGTLSCNGEDNSMYRFSRISLYRNIVAELVERGF